MFRLVFMVFFGSAKSEQAGHAQESSPVILWPLRILALFSLVGGLIGIEPIYSQLLSPAVTEIPETFVHKLFAPFGDAPIAAIVGLLAAVAGFFAAYSLY